MWPINVQTFELEEVYDHSCYQYAILSHTWDEEEVSMRDLKDLEHAREKRGFAKVEYACRQAAMDGLAYAWVDTCCIDKTSSAELSEAINSMFRWYSDAKICYAFLGDVTVYDIQTHAMFTPEDRDPCANFGVREEALARCKWFSRGWTLQELIAPESIIFYDKFWRRIGTKWHLRRELESITGIDKTVLEDRALLDEFPVGRRMSWAAKRHTSRPEDMSYCLIGIFDINMPMLYGEGAEKAFLRLQEEICRRTTDLTLFAWKFEPTAMTQTEYGAFALCPAQFSHCHALVSYDRGNSGSEHPGEIRVTNHGVRFDSFDLYVSPKIGIFMDLKCQINGTLVALHLKKTRTGYVRINPNQLYRLHQLLHPQAPASNMPIGSADLKIMAPDDIYLPASVKPHKLDKEEDLGLLCISASSSIKVHAVCPKDFWDPVRDGFITLCPLKSIGMVEFLVSFGAALRPVHLLLIFIHEFSDSGQESLQNDLVDENWEHWPRTVTNLDKHRLNHEMEIRIRAHFSDPFKNKGVGSSSAYRMGPGVFRSTHNYAHGMFDASVTVQKFHHRGYWSISLSHQVRSWSSVTHSTARKVAFG